MLDAIVLEDEGPPPRPASAARLRAMARQLARARADDDPVRLLDLEVAAARLLREDRERLAGVRAGAVSPAPGPSSHPGDRSPGPP